MMNEEFLTLTIGKQKNIALIAHDSKKPEIISWCEEHKDVLKNHFLCGTGTVSYTHLDVYKRQQQDLAILLNLHSMLKRFISSTKRQSRLSPTNIKIRRGYRCLLYTSRCV